MGPFKGQISVMWVVWWYAGNHQVVDFNFKNFCLVNLVWNISNKLFVQMTESGQTDYKILIWQKKSLWSFEALCILKHNTI